MVRKVWKVLFATNIHQIKNNFFAAFFIEGSLNSRY